jgi:dolichyldiphosphatase
MSILEAEQLKPFSLTYVVYNKNDKYIGFIMSLFTLLPVFLVVMYVTLVVSRRNLHTMYVFVFQLVNEVLNFLLKNYFKQQRPDSSTKTDDYGFPSNHSQFVTFFAVYWSFYFIFRNNAQFTNKLYTIFMVSAISIGCGITCYSRVYLGYHTPIQIYGGIFFGFIFGAITFVFYDTCCKSFLHWIESTIIGKYFYLRNTEHIVNLLKYEYEVQHEKYNYGKIKGGE